MEWGVRCDKGMELSEGELESIMEDNCKIGKVKFLWSQ